MEEEYEEIGKIDSNVLKEFYSVSTDRLIITKERIAHINKRHRNDYTLYGKYILEMIKDPDYILKDVKNTDTVLYLKTIKDLNLQIVIKLQTENNPKKANTIITFWHMRQRSYGQIIHNNKKIFQKTRQN